jgi:hypothetical protein
MLDWRVSLSASEHEGSQRGRAARKPLRYCTGKSFCAPRNGLDVPRNTAFVPGNILAPGRGLIVPGNTKLVPGNSSGLPV